MLCVGSGVDPSNMIKIIVVPLVCVVLVVLMAMAGFIMVRKK